MKSNFLPSYVIILNVIATDILEIEMHSGLEIEKGGHFLKPWPNDLKLSGIVGVINRTQNQEEIFFLESGCAGPRHLLVPKNGHKVKPL